MVSEVDCDDFAAAGLVHNLLGVVARQSQIVLAVVLPGRIVGHWHIEDQAVCRKMKAVAAETSCTSPKNLGHTYHLAAVHCLKMVLVDRWQRNRCHLYEAECLVPSTVPLAQVLHACSQTSVLKPCLRNERDVSPSCSSVGLCGRY